MYAAVIFIQLFSLPWICMQLDTKLIIMATIARSDIELGEVLGSGGFGTVYFGRWKPQNMQVAVKKLIKADFHEIEVLTKLQHQNIVTLHGVVLEDTDLMIVMELCALGSLRSFLEQRVDNPLSPSLIHDWMIQAALPIDYLRHHKLQHMDIKTDNYVITSNMILKLTDFGLSQNVENTRSFSSEAGSWRWMSPERLRDHKLSPKLDIYALALVFWCLFMRVLPYAKYASQFTIAKAVCDEKVRPLQPPTCPNPTWELIDACWDDDRSKRPDIRDVIVRLVHHKAAFSNSVQHKSTQTKPQIKPKSKSYESSDASIQTMENGFKSSGGSSSRSVQTDYTNLNALSSTTRDDGDKLQSTEPPPLPARWASLEQEESLILDMEVNALPKASQVAKLWKQDKQFKSLSSDRRGKPLPPPPIRPVKGSNTLDYLDLRRPRSPLGLPPSPDPHAPPLQVKSSHSLDDLELDLPHRPPPPPPSPRLVKGSDDLELDLPHLPPPPPPNPRLVKGSYLQQETELFRARRAPPPPPLSRACPVKGSHLQNDPLNYGYPSPLLPAATCPIKLEDEKSLVSLEYANLPSSTKIERPLEDTWKVNISEFTMLKELGHTQLVVTRLAKMNNSHTYVAVKIMKEGNISEKEFLHEAKVMRVLSHEHVIQLYGVILDRPMRIMTEFMAKGCLLDYLKTHSDLQDQPNDLRHFAVQVCSAMGYLEKLHVVHRDLAARHCHISWNDKVKVGSFHAAMYVDGECIIKDKVRYPIRWTAPETLLYAKLSSKCDVWSFGVLLWEVFSGGKTPYENMTSNDDVEEQVTMKGYRMERPNSCPEEIYQIIMSCWSDKPEYRPSFNKLYNALKAV